MPDAEIISVPDLLTQARVFAEGFAREKHPELLGVTDGKAVGTYIETAFKRSLREIGLIEATEGNAAKGIDLPSLNTDIKVTSIRQPQSLSPFATFRQKVEGLGYDLMLFVYSKLDAAGECSVEFPAVRHIPARLTGDYVTTRALRSIDPRSRRERRRRVRLPGRGNIPADEATLREYAGWLLDHPPAQGYLTISNALQWRLQYSRVVAGGIDGIAEVR